MKFRKFCLLALVLVNVTLARAQDATDGLIAYYSFEELLGTYGTVLKDYSGNDRYGVSRDVILTDGKEGMGGDFFNKENSRVEIPSHAVFDYSEGLTVCVWVYKEDFDIYIHSDTKRDLKTTQFFIWSDIHGSSRSGTTAYITHEGFFEVRVADENMFTPLRSRSRVESKEWTHLAYTYDNNEIKVYINGKLEGVKEESLQIRNSGGTKRIGRSGWGRYHFGGIIDEMYIYNRALSAEEINQIMNSIPAPEN